MRTSRFLICPFKQSRARLIAAFGKKVLSVANTPMKRRDFLRATAAYVPFAVRNRADVTADTIVLRFFKWDVNSQSVETLDTLCPFTQRS